MGYYSAGGAVQMVPSHRTEAPPASSAVTDSGRKRPSMDPLNVRAARRAMRRLQSFERITRRVISFTRPHAGRKFKFGKRKRK